MDKLPDFIIIPHQVVLDDELNPVDKFLYGAIYWLVKLKNEKCTASNKTLMELSGAKSTNTVRSSLLRLENRGYIKRSYFDNSKKKRDEIIPLLCFGVASNKATVASNEAGGVASNEAQKKKRVKEEKIKNNNTTPSARDVVNFFFELKGWANKGKSFYKENRIIYSRFLRPAKDLLELCEGDFDEAKECLQKVGEWANSRELDWGIETVFKKWYEIDDLKPKAKKPHWDGCRIFQKTEGGKWFIIRKGEVLELGREIKSSEIEWR